MVQIRTFVFWMVGLTALNTVVVRAARSTGDQSAAMGLTSTEKWVLQNIAAGKAADLSAYVPVKNDHILRNEFLENLLVGNLTSVKRNGVTIRSAVINGPIDLADSQVSYRVRMDDCEFMNDVNFAHAVLTNTVSFQKCRFMGNVDFSDTEIRRSAEFRYSVFKGEVSFTSALIEGELRADEAIFNQNAFFDGMKVGKDAVFLESRFQVSPKFTYAEIGGYFAANGAHFSNPNEVADFTNVKVGKSAIFDRTVFAGPADFEGAIVAGDFYAREAGFNNTTKVIKLDMDCQRAGIFTQSSFAGPVSFADSRFLTLLIANTDLNSGPIPQLDLSGAYIKRELTINRVKVDNLVARSLHVEGPAAFKDLAVRRSANLTDGDYSTLDLSGSVWPTDGIQMQRMNYKDLRTDADQSKSNAALLKLAEQSPLSADVYGNLERFFVRQGNTAYADRAFIAEKRRERRQLHGFQYLSSLLNDWLIGYGRRPFQTLFPCAVIVVLGSIIFSYHNMEVREPQELQKPLEWRAVYNPFWYSLGLFLPLVDVEATELWQPKPNKVFVRHYMRIHIILGRILTPIAASALTLSVAAK